MNHLMIYSFRQVQSQQSCFLKDIEWINKTHSKEYTFTKFIIRHARRYIKLYIRVYEI